MKMEKGDILGLIGMALGISAATNIILYFVFIMIPLFQTYWIMFMIIFYATIYGGGIAALILSILGISKNGSKFGLVGLITSSLAIFYCSSYA